jgi:hypothetical protein
LPLQKLLLAQVGVEQAMPPHPGKQSQTPGYRHLPFPEHPVGQTIVELGLFDGKLVTLLLGALEGKL